jgi:hypothetical protein
VDEDDEDIAKLEAMPDDADVPGMLLFLRVSVRLVERSMN